MTTLKIAALAVASLLPALAHAQDAGIWSGPYAGFATNIISPEFDASSAPIALQEGTSFGFFGGYNYAVTDSFVVGAEIAYGAETTFQADVSDEATFGPLLSGRVRGGYAVGNVLMYGTLGYQMTEFTAPGISTDLSGVVYGIGLEAMLADTVSFRVDYTSTHMNPEDGGLPGGGQIDANAVGLGVALHF